MKKMFLKNYLSKIIIEKFYIVHEKIIIQYSLQII